MRPTDADALMPLFIKKAYGMKDRHGVKPGEDWLLNYDDIKDVIDHAPPIETNIENLISTLSVESLKSTTWFKVDTPAGESFVYKREKTGHWLYRHYNWWCSECGKQPKTMGYVGTADFMFEEFKFCNHCGAKMIGVEKLEFFDRRLNDLEDRETKYDKS